MGLDIEENLPSYVKSKLWLPLVPALIAICCFSFFYMKRYRKKYESDRLSFFVSVFALVLVFILTALAPFDTFIVSVMKTNEGTFRGWATDLKFRESIEYSVLIGYIVLYGAICFTIFCVLPFTYFLYDSKNDEDQRGRSNYFSAFISTLIVLVIPLVIFIISLFVRINTENHKNNSTSTFSETINSFVSDGGSRIIQSLVCFIGGLGMLNLIIYSGFGLSSWPIGMIRGFKNVKQEFEEMSREQMNNTAARLALRSRLAYLGRLNEEDEASLRRLENKEREDQIRETYYRNHLTSWKYKFSFIIRPVQILFGILFLSVSIVIIASLIINNIDAFLHSSAKEGYYLKKKSIFNPIDFLLLKLNRFYPLDCVFYLAICWYLIFCTFSGLRNLGIGLFVYKLSKFKPNNTTPQGMILGSAVLMMSMMGINLLMYSIAPIYSSFGNQVYSLNETNLVQCDLESPNSDCTMTRSSYLIQKYFYNIPIIGMSFFFSTWLVALFFVLAIIYSSCRPARKAGLNELDSLEFEDDNSLLTSGIQTRSTSFANQNRPF